MSLFIRRAWIEILFLLLGVGLFSPTATFLKGDHWDTKGNSEEVGNGDGELLFLQKLRLILLLKFSALVILLKKEESVVPGEGVEPSLPHRKTDFKSVASAIPPSGQI